MDQSTVLGGLPGVVVQRTNVGLLQKLGCSLPVTPEFKGITIGGTLAGGGLESSSALIAHIFEGKNFPES